MTRVLCVAEKPSIAKAVANHLSGQARAVSVEIVVSNTKTYPAGLELRFVGILRAKSIANTSSVPRGVTYKRRKHLLVWNADRMQD